MDKIKEIKIIVFALLIAGAVALIVRFWLFPRAHDANVVSSPKMQVLVANSRIMPGERVSSANAEWKVWTNALTDQEILTPEQQKRAESGVVKEAIEQGEPVSLQKITQVGDHGILAAIIAPGMRAFTIPVGRSSSVSSLISPGDYVDVIITSRLPNGNSIVAKTVVENVKVLEVDGSFQKTEKGSTQPPHNLTVEVSERKAAILAAELKNGEATLSLRSIAGVTHKDGGPEGRDSEGRKEEVINQEEESKPIPEPDTTKEITISVMRGAEKTEVTVKR